MGSLIDELQRREAAVRAQAEELRGQIAQLAEQLAGVEEQLSRLVTAREVVDEVLDRAAAVKVAEDAGPPLRAAQFAAAAGLSTDRGKVETLRSKLKRLAERGWLAESAGPGLFRLPARNGSGLGETVKPG